MLQASGVDVATAMKLAGHKTRNVTFNISHSLRDGRDAVIALYAACSETLTRPLDRRAQ